MGVGSVRDWQCRCRKKVKAQSLHYRPRWPCWWGDRLFPHMAMSCFSSLTLVKWGCPQFQVPLNLWSSHQWGWGSYLCFFISGTASAMFVCCFRRQSKSYLNHHYGALLKPGPESLVWPSLCQCWNWLNHQSSGYADSLKSQGGAAVLSGWMPNFSSRKPETMGRSIAAGSLSLMARWDNCLENISFILSRQLRTQEDQWDSMFPEERQAVDGGQESASTNSRVGLIYSKLLHS